MVKTGKVSEMSGYIYEENTKENCVDLKLRIFG